MGPESKEAEMACIGSALTDSHSARYFVTELQPEMFYSTANQTIAKFIHSTLKSESAVDVVILGTKMRENAVLGDAGGSQYLLECMKSISTTNFFPYYAKLVLESWYDRQMEAVASLGAGDNAERIYTLHREKEAVTSVQGVSIRHAVMKVLDGLDEKYELMKLGIQKVDDILGGVEPGDLTTIAARTGNGKTAILISLALKMAKAGKRIVFFAGEMGPEQIVKRALANESGVNHFRIRTRKLDPAHLKELTISGEKMSKLPIHFSDIPSPSLKDIRGLAESFNADVVMIDYLTRCNLPKSDNYRLSVNAFMVGLKNFLRETNRYGILAAQIGRNIDKSDKAPYLSDIKESSSIEEESDQVILLYLDQIAKSDNGSVFLNAFIAKNRHGETGECRLIFNKPLMRVE